MEKEFAGKVALVTGAAKNIGRAIALELADAGAAVGVNTLSSKAEAQEVVKTIAGAGGQAEVFMADIADAVQVQAMVEAVVKRFGRLDMLVLNASYRKETPFMEMSFEDWRRVMAISLDGSFHCIKASLPHLIKSGSGNIVTLTGEGVLVGAAGKVNNSAAKNGLAGMTRALARELAQYGIRANCVSPGAIETSRPAYRPPKAGASRVPLGRNGDPREIATAVRFLCGSGASYLTGQTLHVSGGTLMGF